MNDLLITDDGAVDRVVLSVNATPQAGRRPLQPAPFCAETELRNPRGQRAWRSQLGESVVRSDNRLFMVMLPGACRDTLAGMETFRFGPITITPAVADLPS